MDDNLGVGEGEHAMHLRMKAELAWLKEESERREALTPVMESEEETLEIKEWYQDPESPPTTSEHGDKEGGKR